MDIDSVRKIAAAIAAAAALLGTSAPALAQTAQPPASSATAEGQARKFTIFIAVKTRDAWLKLTVAQRLEYIGRSVFPLLRKAPAVRLRFFDAEFYSARLSDMMVFETTDLKQYESLIDGLRDQEFWHTYFDVLDITLTTETPFADFSAMRTMQPK